MNIFSNDYETELKSKIDNDNTTTAMATSVTLEFPKHKPRLAKVFYQTTQLAYSQSMEFSTHKPKFG